jgi:hypothetical protein
LLKSTPEYFWRKKSIEQQTQETVDQDVGGSEIPCLIWRLEIHSHNIRLEVKKN